MIQKGLALDDLISRQAVIELWEKYHHTIAVDAIPFDKELKALPRIPPEVTPHRNYQYLSDYWCECGQHLGKKYIAKYCPDCGRKVAWNG